MTHTQLHQSPVTIPPQIAGWPLTNLNFFNPVIRVIDIDKDGIKEVFFTEYTNKVLTCRQPDGKRKAGWSDIPVFGPHSRMHPLFYDLDGDDTLEIIVNGWRNSLGQYRNLGVYDSHGQRCDTVWENTAIYEDYTSTDLLLLDLLPASSGPELVVPSSHITLYSTQLPIHALRTFVLPNPSGTGPIEIYTLAGGDLDQDGAMELVGVASEGVGSLNNLYLFRIAFTDTNHQFWIVKIGEWTDINPSLVLGDLNNDGMGEIVVAVTPLWNPPAYLLIFDHQGNVKQKIERLALLDKLALADLNNDGKLEILCATNFGLNVYTHDGWNYKNWPQPARGELCQLAVGDLDSDGIQEVILETHGDIYVWSEDGTLLADWPLRNADPAYGSGALYLTDLDADNDVDLLCISGMSCYAFDFSGYFNPHYLSWPMARHDIYQTGWYEFVAPVKVAMPRMVQTCVSCAIAPNFPNPFNASTTFKYIVHRSQWITIKIYNLQGQLIATLVNRAHAPGVYNVSWDCRQVSSGVYIYKICAEDSYQIGKCTVLK